MAQVAIITASDSGIGKECALLLAQQGFDIGITWHSDEEGQKIPRVRWLATAYVRRWCSWISVNCQRGNGAGETYSTAGAHRCAGE